MIDKYNKLQQILDVSLELAQVRDIDVLLEKILSAARRLVNADAGSIYIKDEDDPTKLHFSYTQNETLQRRLPTGKKLPFNTFSIPINHRSISGYVASTGEILNISDVYHLSDNTSYAFDPSFDRSVNYRTQSMLTFPLKNPPILAEGEDDIIGVMQLINACSDHGSVVPFSEQDLTLIQPFANTAASAIKQAQMTRAMILGMIRVAELRDPKETGPHVKRVGAYASEIYEAWAQKRKKPRAEIDKKKDALRMTAMLHDVGKVAIEDGILKKPAKLTNEEYDRMKQHTFLGARLLIKDAQSDYHKIAGEIALNHHERWDGRGYPGWIDPLTCQPIPGYADESGRARGKKGEEIPIFGRIVAVADVYDALSCRRSYKDAWKEDDVLNELRKCAGTQFDPEVIDAFFDCIDSLRAISRRFPDEELHSA